MDRCDVCEETVDAEGVCERCPDSYGAYQSAAYRLEVHGIVDERSDVLLRAARHVIAAEQRYGLPVIRWAHRTRRLAREARGSA